MTDTHKAARACAVKIGQRVRIKNDGDGAEGQLGTIRDVYRSGRLCVTLDVGGFRNLPPDAVLVIE